MQPDKSTTCERIDKEMSNRVIFSLTEKQVSLLREQYSDIPIVKKVLETEKNLSFDISEEDDIEFYGWLEDESCRTMENGEPTELTYRIEGILDSEYAQTAAM